MFFFKVFIFFEEKHFRGFSSNKRMIEKGILGVYNSTFVLNNFKGEFWEN